MQKAKSRLKTSQQPQLKSIRPRGSLGLPKKYFKHLPLLFLSLPFYFGAYYILTAIHPTQIQHFLIPNTYLPLQLVFFCANFFFFSFLMLKTRRGLELSLLLGFALFLKLQGITNYSAIVTGLLAIFLVVEILFSLLKKK
ncbi:hypothetical protein KJ707_02850 [Patescibacteria group bacterium]|nr:hypothetical protein [Patescibacteria group bacterium]MBU2543476.1 hypothetical protein [Patescibacteria group bacterium]